MIDMTVGVVGNGVVGQATARTYLEHVKDVRVYDRDPLRCHTSLELTLQSDVVFICLPTPQKENSLECDTSAIEDFFSTNYLGGSVSNFVIRSTVPIGYTRSLKGRYNLLSIAHSPEFLTARVACIDAQCPSRNIIGSIRIPPEIEVIEHPDGGYTQISHPTMLAHRTLYRLYTERWPHIPVHCLTCEESEASKLYQNAHFAVIVALWNELRCHADKLGLNWNAVRNAILADGRIHSSHTQVPGPDGNYGFGGTCLPKDLASLVGQMEDVLPYPPVITRAALNRNSYDRARSKK